MPEVWAEVKIKGRRGEVLSRALLNTGARIMRLPSDIAAKIDPEPMGKGEFRLADGTLRELDIYRVEVSYQDLGPVEVRTVILPVSYPLVSIEAMEKLGIIPDVVTGRVIRRK